MELGLVTRKNFICSIERFVGAETVWPVLRVCVHEKSGLAQSLWRFTTRTTDRTITGMSLPPLCNAGQQANKNYKHAVVALNDWLEGKLNHSPSGTLPIIALDKNDGKWKEHRLTPVPLEGGPPRTRGLRAGASGHKWSSTTCTLPTPEAETSQV